jgi:hypothetical protein
MRHFRMREAGWAVGTNGRDRLGGGLPGGRLWHEAELREQRHLVVVEVTADHLAVRVENARARTVPARTACRWLGTVQAARPACPSTVKVQTTASPASRYWGSVIRMSLDDFTHPGRKSPLNSSGVRKVRPWRGRST